MKAMIRPSSLILTAISAAIASGCIASDIDDPEMFSDEADGETSGAAAALVTACPTNFMSYRGRNGLAIECTCSASATQSGSVWGTEIYTDDSSVCRAAVHAGRISADGGTVKAIIQPGRVGYPGSLKYGVSTYGYSSWSGSYSFQNGGVSPAGTRTDWMSNLHDDAKLIDIVVPGTHDTGAYDTPSDVGETQDWSVATQLANGIRFLDVRISNASPGAGYRFELRHGDLLSLGDFEALVMNPVNRFLSNHPHEVVMMSLKAEGGSLDSNLLMSNIIQATNSKFVTTGSTSTTLGTVRGKIVVFDRIGVPGGIDWNSSALRIQDDCDLNQSCWATWYPPFINCEIDYPAKAAKVVAHLDAARTDVGSHYWIDFASAQWNGMYIGNSAAVSNESVRGYFSNLATQARGGSSAAATVFGSIIPMDYPNRNGRHEDVLDAIIDFNLQRWTQFLAERGGGGGDAHELECNGGDVAVGIHGRSGVYVDRLGLQCATRNSDGSPGATYNRGPYGGSGGGSFSQTCPSGQVVVGLYGRSGQYIDRVGLDCATVSSWSSGGTVSSTTSSAGGRSRPCSATPGSPGPRATASTSTILIVTPGTRRPTGSLRGASGSAPSACPTRGSAAPWSRSRACT
jgi:LCCL domain